jgi:hypothetical protein
MDKTQLDVKKIGRVCVLTEFFRLWVLAISELLWVR